MDWFRIRHTLGLILTSTAVGRAEYMKKHDLFYQMGDNCMVMLRKVPLYPKLISLGSNVWIASQVSLITHDVIHDMLNNRQPGLDLKEKIGVIEIKDNVFVGANTTILPDVTIGPDVIVGAGSLVTKSLPGGGVYAGVPAKYICSIEDFLERRKRLPALTVEHSKTGLSKATVEECWERYRTKSK